MPNTIEENLNRLKATVSAISNAIIAKGGTVGAGDGLEEFAADIVTIKNDLTSIDITENGTFYSGDETVVTSSTFPIVINDSNGTPVRHADINGNTIQDDTPTPEAPVEVQGCGERTEQLYFKKIVGGSIGTEGGIVANPSFDCYVAKVEANKQYIGTGFVYAFYTNEPNIGSVSYNGQRVASLALEGFTAPIDGYVAIRHNAGVTDAMLNLGSTALPYEPYGYKIPISSASTTTPVYLGEVETTRQIKKLVLTGEENLNYSAESYGYCYTLINSTTFPINNSFCSHFKNSGYTGSSRSTSRESLGNEEFICVKTSTNIYFRYDSVSDANEFKAYLRQQYAAGTPVTVWYVLAEPETAVVNEPLMKIGDYADSLSVDVELPLSRNTENSIDVTTTLKPSSASFTYNKLSEYIGYNEINVDVPNTYTAEDEGKVVSEGNLIAQTAMLDEITENGTINTTIYNSVTVNVASGGGSSSNAVNFYDYDGTIVRSYSADDFTNLSELPANPTHDGLTAQGWNWSLADAKTYVSKYGKLNIGQMYITSDGKTRLYYVIPKDSLTLDLYLTLDEDTELDVDWGDNSEHTTWTSNDGDSSKSHEYSDGDRYTVAITVVSGGFSYLSPGGYTSNYDYTLKKVEFGSGVTNIGYQAFYYCCGLTSITIPSSVTSIVGGENFYNCYSLSSITIPNGVTSIEYNTFSNCYALSSIALPNSITSISSSYAFYACYALSSITIPNSVTSIGSSAFVECYALSSITIPSSVTSIKSNALYDGLSSITFKSTTPPDLDGDLGISTTCIIRVPQGTLSDYTSASNYPDPSEYIYEEY